MSYKTLDQCINNIESIILNDFSNGHVVSYSNNLIKTILQNYIREIVIKHTKSFQKEGKVGTATESSTKDQKT